MTKLSGVLAGCAVLLVALAAPASAQTDDLRDRRGDADRPALDWTRLTVSNTSASVSARMAFVNLPAKGTRVDGDWYRFAVNLELASYDVAEPYSYLVGVSRRASTRTKLTIFEADPNGGGNQVTCPAARTTWRAGADSYVSVTIPRSCLANLSMTMSTNASSAYPADYEGSLGADMSNRYLTVPMD